MGTKHWDVSKMPPQHGKVAIVTGANSGIGYLTARGLAEHGAHVILACRSEERGRETERTITEWLATQSRATAAATDAPGKVELMLLDMNSLSGVEAFADRFRARFDHLDILINNAGVALPPQSLTADGVESHFGVNHLAHFHLTSHLFESLKASAAARIVTVSSIAHREAKLNFDTLVQGTDAPYSRYCISKLANLLFTYELARRMDAAGITNVISVGAHPGFTATPIYGKMIDGAFPRGLRTVAKTVYSWLPFQSPEMGALSSLFAATAEGVKSGEYFGPAQWGGRRGFPARETSAPTSHSQENASTLWDLSEKLRRASFTIE